MKNVLNIEKNEYFNYDKGGKRLNTKDSMLQFLIKQCRYDHAGKLERAEGGTKNV